MLVNVEMYTKSASPEKALLSQVVLCAINDGCSTPSRVLREKQRGYISYQDLRMSTDAFTAMRFLMDDSVSGLAAYCAWLDIDPVEFRKKLIKLMNDRSAATLNGYSPTHRRSFCINLKMWETLNDYEKKQLIS